MAMSKISQVAHGIRKRVLAHTIANNGGYMSQACSAAELLAALYLEIMKLLPVVRPLLPKPFPGVPSAVNHNYFTGQEFNGPHHPDYDRFYLSPSQYALVLYAALIEVGRMDECGLLDFNKDGSSVEMIGAEHSPGLEVTGGSLGQCLSQAAGVAWARKRHGEMGRNFVFMSDGEFQIGQTWEALQAIHHHRLNNLVIYVDVNGQQCDGTVVSVMDISPLDARLQAFGARVFNVDGHDIEALLYPARLPDDGHPVVVLAKTDPCRGLELLRRNSPYLHYLRFKSADERKQYEAALAAMA